MFKTFTLGLILGVVGTAALMFVVPAVDIEREQSIVTVRPNGGIQERFYANLPADRIMAYARGGEITWPVGVEWPEELDVGDTQTEVFKLRNADDRVVGVASRLRSASDGAFVEWTLHLPARGTLYLLLDATADASGARSGYLRAGTREFETRSGQVVERFVAGSGKAADAEGRLEILTSLVGPDFDDDIGADLVAEAAE